MQYRRSIASALVFGLAFYWVGLTTANDSKFKKSGAALPALDAKYIDYQKRVEKLFLHGTIKKVEEAAKELDVRVVECRKSAAVKKLANSIVAKRFENTTAKQRRALEYYLLVETLDHLKQDYIEARKRTEEIRQQKDEYNSNLAALEERKRKMRKVKQQVGYQYARPDAVSDDDKFAVEVGETSFLKVKLPQVTPVSMKRAEAVKDAELEVEIATQMARAEALRAALTDVEATGKALRRLWKAILGSLKKAYSTRVDDVETISQI